MRINHNMMAINTHRQMGVSNLGASKSMEKLSSGYRINRAGDDAAGLAISEKMRGQIRGLNMASRNAQDTISLIQTAEGALAETQSVLQRMRELAVQSANDTNTDADRVELHAEVHQLKAEIDRIANSTEFNTRKLLEGSAKGVAEEVPATAKLNNNSNIAIDSFKMNAMMESVSQDRGWAFDGAFMLIKTNQTVDANNTPVYNANDYSLVGPDGTIYKFQALGMDTVIKASEMKPGNIIADGGALINVANHNFTDTSKDPDFGTVKQNPALWVATYKSIGANDPDLAKGITTGAAFTDIELMFVGSGSVLASGSSFTLNVDGAVYLDPASNTGAQYITYDSSGMLKVLTDGGRFLELGVGKIMTLNDGTVIRNNGGGKVTVENGGLTIAADPNIPAAEAFANSKMPTEQEWNDYVGTNGNVYGMIPGLNVSSFYIAPQSFLSADSITAKDGIDMVLSSNYAVDPGILGTNVTIGNSLGLNGYDVTGGGVKSGDISLLNTGSVLARGSTVELLQDPGRVTSFRIVVEGNEVEVSYDPDRGILKVGEEVVPPGKSTVLSDGTILTHCANLDTPNTATGKLMVEVGRITVAETLSSDTMGATPATNNNVKSFTAAKDSTLTAGTILNSAAASPTRLMAGTIITAPNKVYSGSVTLGHNGTNLQFSANTGAGLAARYYETKVGETMTFVFSRYEPAGNNLRDSIMTQIGANSGQTAFISMGDMRARALGVADVDISSKFGAATGIETINNALQRVSHQRAILGAMQNRLEHSINSLDASSENLQAAESRIRDVDMAKEIMEYTKNSILQQSAQAMLAQANQVPQNVLQLLR